MAGARKFGTFSGVFTPSILTILGVIMYLRLPSIVGQAGLLTAIGIVLIAHVISVTTGLSVASVATDKKVRGGGTYYMLSRSLGLPIGGTLGIALFVGLSFAVSLYIIGFAESFLGFWGVEATKNAIRLTGMIVLVLVTVVTVVSTSLALRAQFFILAAIALSLLSIVLGVGRHELGPATLSDAALDPLPMAAPFIVLFGIFFPAVTGFEAGVSMSGDLRDPKRSIPVGTIAAIALGLIVYLLLSTFLAYTVDARQLATNPQVLVDIALAPPLVLAGVWGATISSALGSILAAPRILQAVSVDRITPAFFGRGYGRDNEPRRALMLTFLFAAAGILIGELDVIARVVSMFFITAYGFLNLACAIESWASPDFRPSFQVSRMVPIVGALACLIVMIQLDFLAMIGATLLLGGLYFYLTRRQLQLDTGDAWSGFWAGVARAALHRLDRSGGHRRNWRPNVLAFALPGTPRGPLLELARELAGRRGILTAIDVVAGHSERSALLRPAADGNGGGEAYGVFARTVECSDAYECVAAMSRYHGFAGVEPNALLVPWPESPNPAFTELLESLGALDQNVMLLAAADRPAGAQPRVDVWWWGEPANAVLQLSLLRALVTNDTWQTARVRVLTVAAAGGGADTGVTRRMMELLEEMRVDAEVHVVRDVDRKRTQADVIAEESADADLVILDAAPLSVRPRVLDVGKVDALRVRLRSTLFTLPSSFFTAAGRRRSRAAGRLSAPASQPEDPGNVARGSAGDGQEYAATAGVERGGAARSRTLADVRLPSDSALAGSVVRAAAALESIAEECVDGPLRDAWSGTTELLERAHVLVDDALGEVVATGPQEHARASRALRKTFGDLLFHSQQLFEWQREHVLPQQASALNDFSHRMLGRLDDLPDEFEPAITVERPRSMFAPADDDSSRLRAFKLFRRALSFRRPTVRVSVPLRDLVRHHLTDVIPAAERVERDFIAAAAAGVSDVQTLLAGARDALDGVGAAIDSGTDFRHLAEAERARLRGEAEGMTARHRVNAESVRSNTRRGIRQVAHRLARDLERVDVARRARLTGVERRSAEAAAARARELPAVWQESQALLLTGAELELTLLALSNRVGTIVSRARERMRLDIQNGLVARMRAVRTALARYIEHSTRNPDAEFTRIFEHWPTFDAADATAELQSELREATVELPDRVEALSPASATRLADGYTDDREVVSIALRPLVDYHLDAEFLGPLQERLSRVPDVYARATDAAQDAVRLSAFRLRDADADDDAATARGHMLDSAVRRIDTALEELEDLIEELTTITAVQLDHAVEGLEPYRLLRETSRLPQYIRARHGRDALTWFEEQRRSVQRFAGEQTVRLLYQRSEAVRFTRELEERSRTASGGLRDLVASVSPDPRIFERLPYHYRQLFLGKPGFSRDFWTGWTAERRLAARAMEQYRMGFAGPLLVTGEPFAGKSALAQALVEEHFADATVHRITPPRERTTDAAALLARIAEVIGVPDGTGDPLTIVTTGSVVVFEDLDAWWERSDDGYAALDLAFELMETHADRCMFVVTADAHAFRFIDRVRSIRRRFLAVIECRPFSAREIGDVIQLRHGSTGLTYEIGGVHEQKLTDLARARYFHRLFEYSGGNIGAALHGWISHIRSIDGERLTVARPAAPDLHPLDRLDSMQKLLLVQLVLHRALPAERLLRLGGAARDRLEEPLAHLRRARVITEDARYGLVINPFVRPFVARHFTEMELVE
ncbi:MAG: amino acid permease [Gemmatimonadetes bacterium]|nr:amino acid permease [Gemmatimonadota bacterium]